MNACALPAGDAVAAPASAPQAVADDRASVHYDVHHDTEYRYASAVSVSRQALHLAPRPLPWQACVAHRLDIEPGATFRADETDAFGNPLTRLEIDRPHAQLLIAAHMQIALSSRAAPGAAIAWEDVVDAFAYHGGEPVARGLLDAARFRNASPFVPRLPALRAYATPSFTPGRSLADASRHLMQRIHSDFRYDATATHIATPLAEVFEHRVGVCQDFAHVMIGCLRALGLPARYVSGYLLTSPPAGQPRLVGADASHAWVSAWDGAGWQDFDPTNAVQPDLGHITLAWGRDFGDVSPLRGVILGGGEHALDVRVTVTPRD